MALLCLLPLGLSAEPAEVERKPNIVFVLADDLGWGDLGFHGSSIRTPHIDRLAAAGVRLERFYALPVCTPTRAALLTGRYPMRCGLQAGVIQASDRFGLPLEERLLPQGLKEAGYVTALVGKWHLGSYRPEYLPTRRGFEQQYGLFGGNIDYFTHEKNGVPDWHQNDQTLRETGYSTELIGQDAVRVISTHDPSRPLFLYVAFNAPHGPLQAPAPYLQQYAALKDRNRQVYSAVVTCMDDAIGRIVEAIRKRGIADDTLILFASDNGGVVQNGSSSGPLREDKGSFYEGGVRVPCLAVWPGKLKPGMQVTAPLHMVDWYPTLLARAGASAQQKLPLDGRDIWPTLTAGAPTPHDDILINVRSRAGAIVSGRWKLHARGDLAAGEPPPDLELYDLDTDLGETKNLAAGNPVETQRLLARLQAYAREAAAPLKARPN